MSRKLRLCLVLLAAGFMLGCSAGGSSPSLVVGSESTGGTSNGGGSGFGGETVIKLGSDAGPSRALSAHIESPPGVTVEFVTLSCANECADVQAVAKGGFPPYTFTWEDGSTSAVRHLCPTATTTFVARATDSGNSSPEFSTPPETAQAHVTANVIQCPDTGMDGGSGGMNDGGTCPGAPIDGTYSGNTTPRDLGSLPIATLTLNLARGAGMKFTGTITATALGLVSDTIPVEGEFDCATSELSLRGIDAASAHSGFPWVFTATNDPSTHTLTGDWAYHCVPGTLACQSSGTPLTLPAPHEQAVLPVGDSGLFTASRTGP